MKLDKKEVENIFKNVNPDVNEDGTLTIKYTEFIAATLDLKNYLTKYVNFFFFFYFFMI